MPATPEQDAAFLAAARAWVGAEVPQGPPGPAGGDGPQGAQGPAGPQGPAGSGGSVALPFVYLPPSGSNDIPALRALIEAGNKSIVFGAGTYYWGEFLPKYDGLVLRGQSLRATAWHKTFNGDCHEMGYESFYEGFTVWGHHDQYSGGGFVTGAGADYMEMERVRLVYMRDHALKFTQRNAAEANGNGFKAENCTFNSFGAPGGPGWEWAVRLPDTDSPYLGNRKFLNMECGGMPGFNLAGSNNTRIEGSSFGGMTMTAACKTLRVSGCRFFDNNAGEILFRGQNHQIGFNQIGHPIKVKNDCLASFFLMGTLGGNHSGIVREDPAGNGNKVL